MGENGSKASHGLVHLPHQLSVPETSCLFICNHLSLERPFSSPLPGNEALQRLQSGFSFSLNQVQLFGVLYVLLGCP